ncbi:MAG: formylglycine-generating enzyme family protein [Magnetococcales bacterium]|nr:formylglycine-generating enzyme family protein [Magnetococcales bacterium]
MLSDREQLTFGQITKPSWAKTIGRDAWGLWVEISVEDKNGKEIKQQMRWIPPGRFMMGSPDDEPGRQEREGPQHEVVLTKGYWLFATPCTQALWQAVMGDNPSEFKSPDRPVEQVSWDDAQKFITKINKQAQGLNLTLPSEVQWEYACRAGTATAIYTGDIEILGERNIPALDPIAWYGGNSGNDFDLENGYDSSGWKEKQYSHKKAGTHPVGQKAPNGWGLYDMLGNVWEWCLDGQRDYDANAEVDPMGTEKIGALRVIRGGSWIGDARGVRGAYRNRNRPDVRDGYLGFRCSRVQE